MILDEFDDLWSFCVSGKAFRQLSKCTHPDRLRGRLERVPSPEEAPVNAKRAKAMCRGQSRRGEIIFNRASAAKAELPWPQCSTHLDSPRLHKAEDPEGQKSDAMLPGALFRSHQASPSCEMGWDITCLISCNLRHFGPASCCHMDMTLNYGENPGTVSKVNITLGAIGRVRWS